MSIRCPSCHFDYGIGDWPFCPHGRPHGGTLLSAIHVSERATVYRNPRTGEVRTPARADQPMPEKYARQGYVREELTNAAAIRSYEKETGRLHERSHYDLGSATAERDLASEPEIKKDPEVTRRLVQSIQGEL